MSESNFAPPTVDDTLDGTRSLSTVVKAIAIVAIMFGAIGLLQGLAGLWGVFMQDALSGLATAGLPPQAQQPYADLMASQQAWMPLALIVILFSAIVSVFMVISGIMTLAKRRVGTLGYAALAAIAANGANVGVQVLFRIVMNAEWDAYFEAMASTPGGDFLPTSTLIGMVVGGCFVVVFSGFWLWAYTAVSKVD